jgi:hypothetical protein
MEAVAIQFNQHSDVDDESRECVECASQQPLETLQIDDINSFLNGAYLFHKEAEENKWKS